MFHMSDVAGSDYRGMTILRLSRKPKNNPLRDQITRQEGRSQTKQALRYLKVKKQSFEHNKETR